MAHTRTLTGTIHLPTGEPWPEFPVDFTLTPSATTAHATLPQRTVTATTDATGAFSIDLEVGVQYEVGLRGAFTVSTFATGYPPGTRFTIVVPDGDTSISLETVRAADATPITPTLMSRLEALERAIVPPGGTTGQVLIKTGDGDFEMTWGSPPATYGGGST